MLYNIEFLGDRSALDTSQALRNMESFTDVNHLVFDYKLVDNIWNEDLTKLVSYLFLSIEISGLERYRIAKRPSALRSDAEILKKDGNINLARRNKKWTNH